MTSKITVGLQKKIGQPNYGSVGASCCVEVEIDAETRQHPTAITDVARKAYATCRQSIETELALHEQVERRRVAEPHARRTSSNGRSATEAQQRAIRTIAGKAGINIASDLEDRFGVSSPSQLTLGQASELIDNLKSRLTPA